MYAVAAIFESRHKFRLAQAKTPEIEHRIFALAHRGLILDEIGRTRYGLNGMR